MASDNFPQFLTLVEAADRARAPLKSVRAWCDRGQLASFRAGRRRLIRADDLLAFLQEMPQPSRERRAS